MNRRTRRAASVLASLVTVVAGALFATPAHAVAAQDDVWFELWNWNSGKCLAVREGSTSSGAEVIQWPCNGKDEQQWFFASVQGDSAEVVNKKSGKCLSIAGGSRERGAKAIQWTCDAIVRDEQWWSVVLTDPDAGGFELHNFTSGMCLAIGGASTANGANAIQWSCNDHWEQKWELR